MPLHTTARRRALAVAAVVALWAPARAQDAAPATPAALPPGVVTAPGAGVPELAPPAATLSGDGLALRRGSTLGETLDGLPGVSSSWFGPNANRPSLRGQDGDRLRVLENGGTSLDASALSDDHALAADPLVVERIDVLRGPAALLYGSSTLGGVVDAIDNRIPRDAVAAPTGAAEARFGGAARERSAAALVETGGGGFALHVDAYARDTDDLRVPAFDRPLAGGGSARRDRIANSASRAQGGAFGGSLVWDRGHLGVSLDGGRNRYGIAADDDVTIRMRRDRATVAGEVRAADGAIRALRGRLQLTDYVHEEIEAGGAVGTTFEQRGGTARVELEHVPWRLAGRDVRGVVGVQAEHARHAALGDEAFVPSSRLRRHAVFALQELALERTRWTASARVERSGVGSLGDAPGAPAPQFGAAQTRRFDAGSAALGVAVDLAPRWQAGASVAYTQRAPTYHELYADGIHVATAAYERGDASLAKERGGNAEVMLQWKHGRQRYKATAWAARYDDYVTRRRTGEPDVVDADGNAYPVHAWIGVPARLAGVELEADWRLLDAAPRIDLEARLEGQRASRRDTGEPLPRIAPLRARAALVAAAGPWQARAEVVHAARGARVPAGDTPTDGWTMVNVSASHRLRAGPADGLLYVRLTNLGNALAYNATSLATVRALVPLPGRALLVGMRLSY